MSKEFKAPVTKRKQKEEEDFPRGGGSGLTPLEYKEVANQADRSLFSEPGTKPTKSSGSEPAKKKRKSTKKGAPVSFENKFDNKKTKVDILAFKRLTEGTKFLGCITDITIGHDRLPELVVALPNNLTGYVNISEISDELIEASGDTLPDLKDYFFIGQWVQCVIIGLQSSASGGTAASGTDKHRRKIFLSLKPFIANAGVRANDIAAGTLVSGAIKSVEDHGYIVSLGMNGIHGFIKNSEAKMYQRIKNNDKPLAVGQVLIFNVMSMESNKKTAQLTVDSLKVSKAMIADSFSFSDISSIMPGDVIEAHITEIQDIGVICKFMGHFDATIDYFHTSKDIITSKKEIEETYTINDKIRARIIYIDLASQPTRIGLSNSKHIMSLSQPNTTDSELGSKVFPSTSVPVGRSFDTITVKRVDSRYGLLCEIEGINIPGYVHISRISDEHLASIPATGKFGVDSTHRGVVVGYDPVDGLFQLSLRTSIIDQPFLRVQDVEVGSVIKGTVVKVADNGIFVELAKGIRGFVPLIHCVDSAVTSSTKKHIDGKFKVGKTVKCRVLSTDSSEKNKVNLTCKDSLINTKLPIITSLDEVEPGMLSDGVITKTNAHGCIVSFYNGIKAFAHISELQEAHVSNLNIFQPGQVKTCRVLEVNSDEQRLKVSFKKSSEVDLSSVPIGSVHKAKIVTIKKDIIHLTLKPSEIKSVLPVGHLSDHLGEQAERIYNSLKEGMIISDLVVITKDETKGNVLVSKKPSLVLAANQKKLITERKDVKEGEVYPGFVRQVANFGVFVEFSNGVDALAFRHSLSDSPDPEFVKYQSVLAKVLKVDPADGKIEVTLKPSEVNSSADSLPYQGEFLASYFKQLERLAKKHDSAISVGTCTEVEVKSAKNGKWTVSYGADKTTSIAENQIKDVKGKAGLKCPAKVLDVDFEADTVDFTLKDSLISTEETKNAKPGKFSAVSISKELSELAALHKSRETIEAVIELVKNDYVVISIPQFNNLIAFAATRSFNNRKDRFISYKSGEKIKVVAAYVPKSIGKGQSAERIIFAIEQASKATPSNNSSKEGKKTPLSGVTNFEDVKEGVIINGRIASTQHTGLDIYLGGKVFGRTHLTDIADAYASSEALTKDFKKGQLLKFYVLNVDSSNKKIDLSLRSSRLNPEEHAAVHDPEIKSIADLVPGGILQGFVSNVADKGLFVALNHKLSGRVKIAELSDDYLKDWKSNFTVGQLVKAKVVSVNQDRNQIELTLKASQIDPTIKAIQTMADFTKGQKVKGTIKAVKEIGVFIKIDNSTVSGLCHISEISENHVPDVSKLYSVGDPVKAKILDIDLEKKRISFGLKSSYFEEGDADEEEEEEEEEGEDAEMESVGENDIEMGEVNSNSDDDEDGDESDEEVENIFAGHIDSENDEEDEDDDETGKNVTVDNDSDVEMTEAAPLSVSSGFNWGGQEDENNTKSDASDSEDDSDDEEQSKKKKAKKSAATALTDETEDLQSQAPQVASDYERLLLGSPNSSYLWINYMAFQLQLSEIGKAREIGQRALKSINFREEQEKMNVWVALMNLENTFGSADTLEEVFKKAVQTCEPKKIYLQLVKIYERSNKIELATELYTTMTKKFGQSSKVWTGFGHFQLHHGNLEAGRELLQRSLKSLPKRKHIKTISKFAQLEFKYGEPERGRTIFEGVMSNYPKRIDLWSVYIDMEIRNGEQDAVRRLFARVVSLKLSSKKMKFFFKKWLGYEKDHGDEDHIEEVKRRALAYVESLSA